MQVTIPVIKKSGLGIPPQFARLSDLATNLWWSWNETGGRLWRQLDPDLWDQYLNPVEMLSALSPEAWERSANSDTVQDLYAQTVRRFDQYMTADDTWFDRHHRGDLDGPIAYLCAEYGVHHSMPMYSGGLGILAGDHAKSASDLGLPFVGVGLAYRRGYFRQHLDVDGTQQHHYPILDMNRLPVQPVQAPSGGQLTVQIEFPGRQVEAAVWSLAVGRVQLLLMDTDLASNDPADRPITHMLYIRGREMRFCQELILGLGSVKILDTLDLTPSVWHVNEGHAAMSILERLSRLVAAGADLPTAAAQVKRSTIFTLHTPVPAGNETFDPSLVNKYLSWWPDRTGNDLATLRRMGWSGHEGDQAFDLGALAIRHASVVNGVSAKHADVVSHNWAHLLQDGALGITNGVHHPTWVANDIATLLDTALGADWKDALVETPDLAIRIHELDDAAIWERHLARKESLARFARARLRTQFARHGASPDELRSVETKWDAARLTIGFARRFATYKRATLVFHDLAWLQAILRNPDRPVQVVFAGKAHPADHLGQGLIERIVQLSKTPGLAGHIHVLEDYDLAMAQFLVQGVDVWLNNPRIPQEASGTSGMKAAMNGGLNVSVSDGWWAEGARQGNGWVFGAESESSDHEAQDDGDATALYRLLQDEIVPLYYDRGADGIPHGWVQMMKEAIATTIHQFSTHRMVQDYTSKGYLPLGRHRAEELD